MANKNTRRNKNKIRIAGKAGNPTVDIRQPVGDYHNRETSAFVIKARPTSIVGKDGLVSCNRRRNLAMRVFRNTDGSGQSMSLTVHEPLEVNKWITPRNHKYLKEDKRGNPYKQPRFDRSVPVVA